MLILIINQYSCISILFYIKKKVSHILMTLILKKYMIDMPYTSWMLRVAMSIDNCIKTERK